MRSVLHTSLIRRLKCSILALPPITPMSRWAQRIWSRFAGNDFVFTMNLFAEVQFLLRMCRIFRRGSLVLSVLSPGGRYMQFGTERDIGESHLSLMTPWEGLRTPRIIQSVSGMAAAGDTTALSCSHFCKFHVATGYSYE